MFKNGNHLSKLLAVKHMQVFDSAEADVVYVVIHNGKLLWAWPLCKLCVVLFESCCSLWPACRPARSACYSEKPGTTSRHDGSTKRSRRVHCLALCISILLAAVAQICPDMTDKASCGPCISLQHNFVQIYIFVYLTTDHKDFFL